MTPTGPIPRLSRDQVGFAYDAHRAPVQTVRPGQSVLFETLDARSGSMFSNPIGELVDLPPPPTGRGNPVTGPLAVEGAQPGDTLLVRVEQIVCGDRGWVGAHAHFNPATAGRVPRSRGRVCRIEDGSVIFSPDIRFAARPMIGCLGVATAGEATPCGKPGRHGGNLDHPPLGAGAILHLPVQVPDALLYAGDVHAAQGDGELSSTGIETTAEITLSVDVVRSGWLAWPWLETTDRIAVLTSALAFEEARREAVDGMLQAMEEQLGLEPAEALALISAVGDLRIGQAFGGMELTVRLEMPADLGIRPLGHA